MGDFFDELIDFLAKLDWFEKVDALFRFRLDTPTYRFEVDRNAGWSGQGIENMLKGYGVRVWDRGFTKDTLKFRTKQVQAEWTEYLLQRHGIPIKGRLFKARSARYGKGKPGAAKPDIIDKITKTVGRLV